VQAGLFLLVKIFTNVFFSGAYFLSLCISVFSISQSKSDSVGSLTEETVAENESTYAF
jgi:hypothetical protein